ncbi:protein traS [Escherichia coli]|uniref:protein traS n=1 Tax=uncultured Escherichia sp. TaxID=237777 RepID=UPI0015FDD2A4|nr:protein traS [uncultured Escherichia sp.]EES8358572.1 protein traS [Escherichia coli]EFH8318744.1 protein traS [Escherichia coli]EFJ1891694.1 protein traS [Escherichia coli]EFK2498259.1 protein traS [Escherichia coli]EFN9815426.1 protein traS [Escherichia coli]
MKRSELEKDVAFILDAFKEVDYEIPSNRNILKVIFSKLVIVYALQVSFIVVDVFFNSKSGEYHYFDTIVLALGSNAFFSVVFLMSTYDSVCMRLALGDEIINQSVFFKLIEKKIGFYSLFLMSVNTIVGFILILKDESLIGGLGFSWFVTYIISMLTLQTSLSRYMTPAVVSSLSKMKELISASPK